MALADTLTGTELVHLLMHLKRTSGTKDNVTGKDVLSHKYNLELTDGASANQATGFFGATFTATTGGITISLADSADPLGAAGDDVPSMDPEGLKLRAIMIENLDDTNFIKVEQGTNGVTSWIAASGDIVNIPAGGVLFATFPAGLDALTDGTDDELKISADTASCSVKISYVFG